MPFKEYRNPYKTPATHEFNIERFAYDVFAFMLRACGLSEKQIPTSNLRENIYNENDFVKSVGLSALQIAMYQRDEWRFSFEQIFVKHGLDGILKLNLESFILYSDELYEEDTLSKIQYSLALYSEFILFLSFIGPRAYLQCLPKDWSILSSKIVAQSVDLDQTLESTLNMCLDVSELWISDFIRNCAIPYGKHRVSDRFCLHALKFYEGNNNSSEQSSTRKIPNVMTEESVVEKTVIKSFNRTATFLTEGSILESNYIAGRCCAPSSDLLHRPIENVPV